MDIFDLLTKIGGGLSGFGMFAGIFIAWKTGLLDYLLKLKKNGNGSGKLQEIDEKIELLSNNHLHETNETLLRIERRLEDIAENTIYIKARINGGK